MIEVELSTIFFLYLCATMGVIFILWIRSEYQSRTRATHVESERTMACSICLQVYIYRENDTITKCPFCQSFNDVVKK